ncbi:hypothetical protein [Solemya pervernicosa gill symbiont]|uniref:hypothetical protein n=1 Tax=Solemya pervernicosa gill symbiont TaxID=642797 RepID=UPI001083BAD9|nr:hypothetical protein [Solemya pervernicosa gill symbiont]
MSVTIPVYSDHGEVPRIEIYAETEEGTFRRTSVQPFNMLRDNIAGISSSRGKIVTSKYARGEVKWKTPTIKLHSGRPKSYYQFLREQLKMRRLYVFSAPSLNGRLHQLDVLELKLKTFSSSRVKEMFAERYMEAVSLMPEPPQSRGRDVEAVMRLRERLHTAMNG